MTTEEAQDYKQRAEAAERLLDQVIEDLGREFIRDTVLLGENTTLAEMGVELARSRRDYAFKKRIRDEARQRVLDTVPCGLSGDAREASGFDADDPEAAAPPVGEGPSETGAGV